MVRSMVRMAAVSVLLVAACAKVDKVELKLAQPLLTTAGQATTATATALDADGKAMEGKTFEFSSSDPSVATVDATGQVKAVKSGEASIVAKVGDKAAEAKVDVRIPARIEMPAEITLEGIGAPVDVAATVLDDAGRPLKGAALNYELGDPSVVTFSGRTLTGIALGSTQLKASFGSIRAEAAVKVVQPQFAQLVFGPETGTIKVGEKLPITFEAKSESGAAVVGVMPSFSSSDEKVATISGGLITGVGPGTATITTQVGDKSATIKVTVKR